MSLENALLIGSQVNKGLRSLHPVAPLEKRPLVACDQVLPYIPHIAQTSKIFIPDPTSLTYNFKTR